jgi:hypothetical protein
MNPEFVGKKSQGLTSQRFTLGSHSSPPLGLCYLRKDQDTKDEYRTEDPRTQDPRKSNRVECIHFFLLVNSLYAIGWAFLAKRQERSLIVTASGVPINGGPLF